MYSVMLDILGIEENVFIDLYHCLNTWTLSENRKKSKMIHAYPVKFLLYYSYKPYSKKVVKS